MMCFSKMWKNLSWISCFLFNLMRQIQYMFLKSFFSNIVWVTSGHVKKTTNFLYWTLVDAWLWFDFDYDLRMVKNSKQWIKGYYIYNNYFLHCCCFVVFFPLKLKKYTQVILVNLEFYFTFDSVLHDLSLSLYMYIVQLLIGQMCTCPIWLKWW